MQGSLHFALDDETVQRFGRDDCKLVSTETTERGRRVIALRPLVFVMLRELFDGVAGGVAVFDGAEV